MKDRQHSVIELQAILDETVVEVRDRAEQIYIYAKEAADEHDKPAPRKADFAKFGLSVFTREGDLIKAGDASTDFPIQSIPKYSRLKWRFKDMATRSGAEWAESHQGTHSTPLWISSASKECRGTPS